MHLDYRLNRLTAEKAGQRDQVREEAGGLLGIASDLKFHFSSGTGAKVNTSSVITNFLFSEKLKMDIGIIKILLFGVSSGFLWYVSRASLRVVRSHGFYRFFAWEMILALTLVNSGMWFTHPLSFRQIISWIFLILSLLLLWNGLSMIRSMGQSNEQRQDATLLAFEKTSVLVTSGIYRYIRHPLYGSLLFLAWGIFLKDVTWLSVSLVAVASICLALTGRADEAECIQHFGQSYEEYMSRTKMFIPFLF